MNGPTRAKVYKLLIQRDGELCCLCGALSSLKQLVIDHKNNNNKDNRLENLQLSCRRCNYLKNPRRPLDLCVSEGVALEQTELAVSRLKEPMFKKYVNHRVSEEVEVPETDLINAGAEDISASPVTTKRYLNKMCSSRGIFERVRIGGTIIVRYKKDMPLT